MCPGRTQPRKRSFACALVCVTLSFGWHVAAQDAPPGPQPVGLVPLMNVGGNYMDAQFARLDFTQMALQTQERDARQKQAQQQLVANGTISALDLAAPASALSAYDRAALLLRQQKSQEAIKYLQKAIATYPKFVSAHNGLGLAYLDLGDAERARREFQTAAALDSHFPGSFINLGRLALAQKDFAAAETDLQKAAALHPDAGTLTALAYAQSGARDYRHTLQTADRVHALPHKGLANIHFIAGSAAVALHDFGAAQREFGLFLEEDLSNPLAPIAQHDLAILARGNQPDQRAATVQPAAAAVQTFPNSERLRNELIALGDPADDTCIDCTPDSPSGSGAVAGAAEPAVAVSRSNRQWVIRKTIEEVAVFFSAYSRGHVVSDLQAGDIRIRDNNRPPARVLQFTHQADLPLRVGLLVDTSGSVEHRFAFEKRAATKFLADVLRPSFDLAFVAGFAGTPIVMQDFTRDQAELAEGVNKLTNHGGTALFDAVSFACWKLAGHPEQDRAGMVLVVVSDGEDNSSHNTLKQALADAETTGVTIYTISTKEGEAPKSNADVVLQTLAERTGGEALFPGDVHALARSFDKLHDLIRSRYLVVYRPADFQPDGRYHTIQIVALKEGKRLQVHTRHGYHARVESKP